ncbi:hypothetical protein LK07_03930 [Streptomyces pluripotens]|uniref:Uncharacterized protein n=1 Tax=Streptomyces pluripotens TaxID=1355015 RepID=A0A221P8S0_9ACTN|nr:MULTISPECIES: hypothetical protein [Streptomyces]ARP73916.1 hypothetical protein LK06_002845 [Streptomyces pluripotens]ASN28175.1 hypothetical protein LK07_03930 [Streptomyces pluripotens]KIE25688.1 hypothetical protein LK08_17860 [Streptomyces sp. MUSC 125]MCH0558967.1 hypothetical protein [Streptomyces sp. MUM 16J]
MDIAKCLALIDLLCTEEFPAHRCRTDTGTGGPGFLIAELQTSGDFFEDDGTERAEAEAQYEADRDALGERLAERWGPADVFSLFSVFQRGMEGEETAQPWGTLASHVPDVHLWRVDPGRWVALGVSQWDGELPFQLLAIVTTAAPP